MFIRKYGKKAFLKAHDLLHERYDFAKTQEILGQDNKIMEKEYIDSTCGISTGKK